MQGCFRKMTHPTLFSDRREYYGACHGDAGLYINAKIMLLDWLAKSFV